MDLRQALRDAWPDIAAGGMFAAFGLFFAVQSLDYELGDPFRMGPGYFPLLLGIVLLMIGVAIALSGLRGEHEGSVHAFPWRGMLLLSLAFVLFGMTVRGLGVGPAAFIATSLAGLASQRVRPITALAIAAGLTVLTVVLFILLLQLRVPIIGPWLLAP